jgi:hypothetical protein
MSTIHRFVATADIPAKGQIVTCPHCGHLEIWTHEEIQDHGLCRHLLHLEGGSCSVCEGVWEGRPEWIPLGHISCDREGLKFPATSKASARSFGLGGANGN